MRERRFFHFKSSRGGIMHSRSLKRIAGGLLVLTAVVALASIPMFAQRLDGTLRGEVTDPTGAVMPDAKVTATNVATGVSNKTTTSSAGTYVFPNLLVGTYTVTVEAPSDSTSTEPRVRFHAAEPNGRGNYLFTEIVRA